MYIVRMNRIQNFAGKEKKPLTLEEKRARRHARRQGNIKSAAEAETYRGRRHMEQIRTWTAPSATLKRHPHGVDQHQRYATASEIAHMRAK